MPVPGFLCVTWSTEMVVLGEGPTVLSQQAIMRQPLSLAAEGTPASIGWELVPLAKANSYSPKSAPAFSPYTPTISFPT